MYIGPVQLTRLQILLRFQHFLHALTVWIPISSFSLVIINDIAFLISVSEYLLLIYRNMIAFPVVGMST